MDRYRLILIGFAIVGTGVLCFIIYRAIRSLPKARENLNHCREEFNRIKLELEQRQGFFRYSEYLRFQGSLQSLVNDVNRFRNILCILQKRSLIRRLRQLKDQLPSIRDASNSKYLEHEAKEAYSVFNDQDGNPLLTQEQVQAVLMDDDQNLIIAGAGSGKTRVIDYKVRYLVQHKGVDPSEILLLSFSRKSTQDLNQKIAEKTKGVTARTIHSLAASIVGPEEFEIIDGSSQQRSIMMMESIETALKKPGGFESFSKFYWNHFYDATPLIHHKNISDLRRNLNCINSDFNPSNDAYSEDEPEPRFKTLKGEYVRSVDERYIADFLFLHGVQYEYERPYPNYRGKYHPDFYLPKFDIYFEHFALNKDGTAPTRFSNPERYVKDVTWKRDLHKKNNTKLIETETWQLNEDNSDAYLREVLKKANIQLDEKLSDLAYRTLSQGIVRLFSKFYNAHTLSGRSLLDLKIAGMDLHYLHFIKFYELFYNDLRARIEDSKQLDFSDLLIKATEIVRSQKKPIYSYIIVDEFQDTSNLAMGFVTALLENHENASLTCVGDDWQSIYGFNGSDVSLLTHYSERNPGVATTFLESNFRSHQRIVDLGSAFVSKNGSQIKKKVVSKNRDYPKSEVGFLPIEILDKKISSIPEDESIFVLYRYNLDCPTKLRTFEENFSIDRSGFIRRKRESKRNIQFMTIHASKGLEAQHVFIVFPDGINRRFPSEIEDHFIFNLVRSSRDNYPFAEERRLFYVAISRAQQNVYLVSRREVENSAFWDEIKNYESGR